MKVKTLNKAKSNNSEVVIKDEKSNVQKVTKKTITSVEESSNSETEDAEINTNDKEV